VYVRSNGKLRLHDVARDAEGLHDKHSILDPRSITVTENMHIGNALAKDGRLYACFHPNSKNARGADGCCLQRECAAHSIWQQVNYL
jgi:hypothetical protein